MAAEFEPFHLEASTIWNEQQTEIATVAEKTKINQ